MVYYSGDYYEYFNRDSELSRKTRFSEDIKPYAQMGIGAVNIFAGILTTIAQFSKNRRIKRSASVSVLYHGINFIVT